MASHQLARDLGDDDVKSIATWLKTLSGSPPADIVTKPELPASTKSTPKPERK
jgi:cytochrome c553